jgi:hypothetical protein
VNKGENYNWEKKKGRKWEEKAEVILPLEK